MRATLLMEKKDTPLDGCGRKMVGTAEVDTDPAFALSMI
jgi:hypothetical protein